MKRALLTLVVLAACDHTEALHCAAVVTGTGGSADGTYQCKQPALGAYTRASGSGFLSGFAFAPNGTEFSFTVNFTGPPAPGTYTESTLPAGATYVVGIFGGSNFAPLWEPGSFTLVVTDLNAKVNQVAQDVWPQITGTLTATLKPTAGNPATTSATVKMDF